MADRETAKDRYQELAILREPALRRARRNAEVTIPSLLPPEGHSQTNELPDPHQSYAARLVTHLAARLMTALLPSGQKSFKMAVPAEILMREGKKDLDPDTEDNLVMVEDVMDGEINRRRWRAPTNLGLQHLIVAGNVLEQMMPDNTLRLFRLDQYVVARAPNGREFEVIIEEQLSTKTLPEDLAELVPEAESAPNNTIPLYTWAKWDAKEEAWRIHQEIGEQIIPDSEGVYEISPLNPLRWVEVIGEDYGRAKAEEHYSDLLTLDLLTKSLRDGSAMAGRHITMVKPNAAGGLNLRRRMVKAENGDVIVGNPDDIEMLQFQNHNGLQVVAETVAELKKDLGAAFLLNSSARRDAERVTAFELRMMIEEIEGVLGGVYSSLSDDMQKWRVTRLMRQMKDARQLPDFPDGMIEPIILTGLEALGREKDVERVATAVQFLERLPTEVTRDYPKWNVLLNKAFNGLGLSDAVHTDEEVAQERQRFAAIEAMMRGMGQTGAPEGAPPVPAEGEAA